MSSHTSALNLLPGLLRCLQNRGRVKSKAGVFFALSVLWVAIWVLDFTYYHQLLRGAVKALLDLEDSSGGELFLSKEIEASVRQGKKYGRGTTAEAAKSVPMVPMKRPGGLWWFYGLVFVVLLAATGGSGYAATRTPNAANAAAAASLSR